MSAFSNDATVRKPSERYSRAAMLARSTLSDTAGRPLASACARMARNSRRPTRRWWHDAGTHDYPDATRLLITAGAGGSTGYRSRAFKTELAALARETGLAITVCHLPPAPRNGTGSSTGCSATSP